MAKKWHVSRGDKKVGPVSDNQLKGFAESGKLRPEDLVWKEGMDEWKPASKIKGLFQPSPAQPTDLPLPVSVPDTHNKRGFCSNCGAELQDGARFCMACGVSIDGGENKAEQGKQNACPICKMKIAGSTKNCEHCQLPIGNPVALQNLKRNLILEQERLRAELPECEPLLESDEFIAYMTPAENNSKTYVLTETRLLVFRAAGWISVRNEYEYCLQLTDVVSYPQMAEPENQIQSSWHFPVNTAHGEFDFWFQIGLNVDEGTNCIEFVRGFQEVHQALMQGSRIAGALLMRTPLV
jgi:hypothetical protein